MENTIVLTDAERMELHQRAASRSGRADDARRARLMLLLEAGHIWAAIRGKLGLQGCVYRSLVQAFREQRLAGPFSGHAGQEATTLTPAPEVRILEWTLKRTPPDGTTQRSTRRLGTQLQISHMTSLGCIWTLRRMRRCSVWMRRRRSRRSTARIRCCHSHRAALSGTALSTFGTERCPCKRRSTPRQARCSARRPCGTHPRSSSRLGGHRRQPSARQRDPRDCRQSLGPKNGASRRISGSTSEGSPAHHPDLFLLA